MTDEEVMELWEAKDLNTLAEKVGVGIAIHVANRLYSSTAVKHSGVDLEDVVSWGLEAAVIAVQSWKPKTSVPLRTWVGNQVERGIKNVIRAEVAQKRGGNASHVLLGTPGGRQREVRNWKTQAEYSEAVPHIVDYNLMTHVWSSEARYAHDGLVDATDLQKIRVQMSEQLTPLQIFCVTALAGGASLRLIGSELGCSHEWVRQQAELAKVKMKELL